MFLAAALTFALSTARAEAQATFFEVPSADVPDRGQVLGQLQLGGARELDVSAIAAVGLGLGFEVGLNAYNFEWARRDGSFSFADNRSDEQDPYGPLLLVGGQKRFREEEDWGTSVGGQVGANLTYADEMSLVARAYTLLVRDFDDHGRCTLGPYVATETFLGNHQRFGGFVGCEIEVIPHRFGFEAEWDAGAHALGKTSLGPRVHIGYWGALSVGAQIPNPWGTADYRAVAQLEVTYPGVQE